MKHTPHSSLYALTVHSIIKPVAAQKKKRKKGFVLSLDAFDPVFDKTHLDEDLKKSIYQRFNEACELYDFFEAVTPFPFKPCVKSFASFSEYEKWKKRQPDPRYW